MLLDLIVGALDRVGDALDFATDATVWGLSDACYNASARKRQKDYFSGDSEDTDSDDSVGTGSTMKDPDAIATRKKMCYRYEYDNLDSSGRVRKEVIKKDIDEKEEMEIEVLSQEKVEKGYW